MKKKFNLLVVLSALLLLASTALAGSFVFWWPNIGQRKALDAVACAAGPLIRTDADWRCDYTSAWTSGNQAAECRFVMALTGNKTVWHLEGQYQGDFFQGVISQTMPSCTGFLCGLVATVQWTGRSAAPAVGAAQRYYYQWTGTGNTAVCDVSKNQSGLIRGQFFGSY